MWSMAADWNGYVSHFCMHFTQISLEADETGAGGRTSELQRKAACLEQEIEELSQTSV